MKNVLILEIKDPLDFLNKKKFILGDIKNKAYILVLDKNNVFNQISNLENFNFFKKEKDLENFLEKISEEIESLKCIANTQENFFLSNFVKDFKNLHIFPLQNIYYLKKDPSKNCINNLGNMDCYGYGQIGIQCKKNNIEIFKCVVRKDFSIIKTFNIEDYKNINIFEELKKCFYNSNYTFICKPGLVCEHLNKEKLNLVLVSISKACNLHCNMCCAGIDHTESLKIKEVYFKTLYDLKNHNIHILRLTDNGEPFFYKKETLEYLISLDPKKDFQIVCGNTNATLFEDPDFENFKKLKVKLALTLSIDSLKKETFEKIRRGGDFEKFLKNIRILAELGVISRVQTIIQKGINDDPKDLQNISDFCKRYNLFWDVGDVFKYPWYNYPWP